MLHDVVISGCRAALAPGAPAALRSTGAALAAQFLDTGLAAGNAGTLANLMRLLCMPLQETSSPQEVGTKAHSAAQLQRTVCGYIQVDCSPRSRHVTALWMAHQSCTP